MVGRSTKKKQNVQKWIDCWTWVFGLGNYYCQISNNFSAAQTYLTFTGLAEEPIMGEESAKEEQLEKGLLLVLVLRLPVILQVAKAVLSAKEIDNGPSILTLDHMDFLSSETQVLIDWGYA